MTKRRAENILPPEIPNKRRLRSRSSPGDRPALRCRKRPKSSEDEPPDAENLPRKVPANTRNAVLGGEKCESVKLEDVDKVAEPPEEENNRNRRDEVTDEEISAFNTFQFWRVPLPELDLSLLDTEPAAGPGAAHSAKDVEAMES